MRKNYLLCGLTGWCAEIVFTSLGSAVHQDWRLMATTSLWMFPIYGLAACIPFIYRKICTIPIFFRGLFYTAGFFLIEFLAGSILQLFKACPWNYSGMPTNYKGIIRLDYAPLWFLLGLFYERMLLSINKRRTSTTKKVAEEVKQ